MTHSEFVALQISQITERPALRAINALRDDFSADDMQSLDAPKFLPPASFGDSITMRHQMVIPGRGGDRSAA